MSSKEQSKVSVIEEYLDCIDSLPVDLSRMLTQIKEHDCLAKDNVKRIKLLSDDLHKTFNNNNETERLKVCDDLLSVLEDNLILGEKKVELAQKTFDMVNARIKRIDEDAAIIEEEEFTSSKAHLNYTNDLNIITPNVELKNIKPSAISAIDNDENTDNTNNINNTNTNNTTTYNKAEKKSTTDSSTLKSRKRQREKDKDKDKDKDREKEKEKDKDKNDKDVNDTKSPVPQKKESKHKNSLTNTKNSNKTRKHSDIKHSKNSNDKSVVMASDLDIDPDEPTYCKCHQVSFGEMIACDNKDCAIEWFHYACVGLVGPPKGKWYCDDCAALMQKKNKKK